MTRGGRISDRTEPERKCIVTGETGPKSGLIRFVVGPDAQIVPDILGRLPGRGIYVSADRSALEAAVKKRMFARGAKQQVTLPDDLVRDTELGLAHRVVDLISLARKAGQAVAGYEKVKSWLETERAAVLLQASDGSERGKSKLRPPRGAERHITTLTASELGLAFGRENVIHGALAGGGLTQRVVEEAARLSALRVKHGGERPVGKGTTTR
ncbi:RNA-binding protein [Qingshengfaniella alkalisoli]|uniref:RNA-binding protein n=1 Tax=Qingshengfaniella alkalisoli TaxID=2599296 RepID=A0A5B8ICW6_9RHOB|nr:RNA-binding protein [Qingshengfaniella alkalisoli]QDY71456.1 RNA-binding protein [Qingshengfaniella alkalisoli]